jgi:hypothetical protein
VTLPDPTTIDAKALLALVQCPPVRPNAGCSTCGSDNCAHLWSEQHKCCPDCDCAEPWYPKEQASPSALQDYAACQQRWGRTYLEGRREPRITWEWASQIPEPPKAERGASALAKAEAEAARKAWNKIRRPALGHEVHAILGAWMVQNVPGCWHPPMSWREIDWMSFAGKVARPACDVLPDPRGLVAVYTELSAEVAEPDGWRLASVDAMGGWMPWPRMPGFYDLITVEETDAPVAEWVRRCSVLVYRLWDFKTTSSFDWAKTAEELADDPQVLLYALHAMQTFGLQEIECNWLYLCTEGKPKAYLVTVVVTREQAEAATIELAHTAADVVNTVQLFRAGRLRVIDLERNISACPAYGGCTFHVDKGGPCDAKTSPGKALKQRAELDAKITARKSARKETEKQMAMDFAARKAAASGTSTEPAADAGTASAGAATDGGGADESAKASAATAKVRTRAATVKASDAAPAPDAAEATAVVAYAGTSVPLPKGSPLAKAVIKICNAQKALNAALAGE